MRRLNESSLGDLLPWQTSEHSPYATNFMQSHAAAIAQMTTSRSHLPNPSRSHLPNPSPSTPQKRASRQYNTLLRNKISNRNNSTIRDLSRKQTSKSQYFTRSSRQQLKLLLFSSLSPQKLKHLMETADCLSPIKVTQISTEQSMSSELTSSSFTSQKCNSRMYLRSTGCGNNQQAYPRKVPFADFLQGQNRKNRGLKVSTSKGKGPAHEFTYRTIHMKSSAPRKMDFACNGNYEGQNGTGDDRQQAYPAKGRLVSSKKMSRRKTGGLPLPNSKPANLIFGNINIFVSHESS